MNTNKTLKTNNPNEPATDAVNRTAQEILAALQAKDSAKVNSYYAPDAVIATTGRPAAKDGRAVSKSVEEVAKIISTFEWASSPASSCSSSTRSAQRNSMRMFLPST